MSVRIRAGTSGFAYKEWKGSFYPEKLKNADMLPYYAERFDAVELNNTFYRLPTLKALEQWRAQVPEDFRFTLKASRIITHIRRLREVTEPVDYLFNTTAALGAARGPILFGLPPNMKLDLERLETLLALIPDGAAAAIEFRHDSWHEDAVLDALRERGVALCIAQTDDDETPFHATAGWGYIRLRREAYDEAELRSWRERIERQEWSEAYVFFKHEDAGTGPRLARQFLDLEI